MAFFKSWLTDSTAESVPQTQLPPPASSPSEGYITRLTKAAAASKDAAMNFAVQHMNDFSTYFNREAIAEGASDGLFCAIKWALLQPEESMNKEYSEAKADLQKDDSVKGFADLLHLMGDRVGKKLSVKIAGSIGGDPLKSQNFITLVVNTMFMKAIVNLSKEAKAAGVKEVNLLSLIHFFKGKIDEQLTLVREGKQDVGTAADHLLRLLFPKGQAELPLPTGGNVATAALYDSAKNKIWTDYVRQPLVGFLNGMISCNQAQADYMKRVTPENKESAEEMAEQALNLVHKYKGVSAEKIVEHLILPYLVPDKDHLDEKDKDLKKQLNGQIERVFADLGPEAADLRAQVVSFLTPIFLSVQRNNIHNIDPKEYSLIHFVDDIAGVFVDAQNQFPVVGKQIHKDMTNDLFEVIGATPERQLPMGKEFYGVLEKILKGDAIEKAVIDFSHLGKSAEVVRKEYEARLIAYVGKDAAPIYLNACTVIAEQSLPAIFGQIAVTPTREEGRKLMESILKHPDNASLLKDSNLRTLLDSIILQSLVHGLEKSGKPGEPAATKLLENLGTHLKTLIDAHGDKIRDIVQRPIDEKHSAAERAKKKAELIVEVKDFSVALLELISPEPGKDGTQERFQMPMAKILEQQWGALGKEVLPDVIAEAILDSSLLSQEKVKLRETLNAVGRETREGEPPREGFGDMFGRLADEISKDLPGWLDKGAKEYSGVSVDAVIDYISKDPSPQARALAVFLRQPGVKDQFKGELVAFLNAHPAFATYAQPLVKEYLEALMLNAAKPLLEDIEKMEKGIKVKGDRVAANKRFGPNLATKLLKNINDHYRAVNGLRGSLGKMWADDVTHEQYVAFFKDGIPQTKKAVELREHVKKLEKEIRNLEKRQDATDNVETKHDIEKQIRRKKNEITTAEKAIHNEEDRCFQAIQRGEVLAEMEKPRALISENMPQSKEVLEAQRNIKVEEKKIKEQRTLLKSARNEGEKRARATEIIKSMEIIAANEKIVDAERSKALKPLVEKILKLIEMDNPEGLPIPDALRQVILEQIKTKGAEAVGKKIELMLSRGSVNKLLYEVLEDVNTEYNIQVEPHEKGPGFFRKAVTAVKRTHDTYFKENEPAPELAPDRNLENITGGLINEVAELVPGSLFQRLFKSKKVQRIGKQAVTKLLRDNFLEKLTITGILNDNLNNVSAPKPSLELITEKEVEDRGKLDNFIKLQLKTLEAEEDLERKTLKAMGKAAARVYANAALSGFLSLGTRVNAGLEKLFGKDRYNNIGLFFEKIYVTAIFNALSTFLSYVVGVPILVLLEALVRFAVAFRGEQYKEMLHLDIHQNLAYTITDTVLTELQVALDEMREDEKMYTEATEKEGETYYNPTTKTLGSPPTSPREGNNATDTEKDAANTKKSNGTASDDDEFFDASEGNEVKSK